LPIFSLLKFSVKVVRHRKQGRAVEKRAEGISRQDGVDAEIFGGATQGLISGPEECWRIEERRPDQMRVCTRL
jgi:hypothetical protein